MKNLNTVSAGRKTVSMEQKEKKLAVILIAPAVIYLILIMGLPLIWAVYTSLTDKVIGAAQVNFVGLSNYIEIIKDPVFQKSLYKHIHFCFLCSYGQSYSGYDHGTCYESACTWKGRHQGCNDPAVDDSDNCLCICMAVDLFRRRRCFE